MQLRMPLFKVIQKSFGFIPREEAQSFIIGLDHFPCASPGGQGIGATPCAGSYAPVDGGSQEAENAVYGLTCQSLPGLRPGHGLDSNILFGFCVALWGSEQFRLEIGEQSGTQVGNRQIVDFSFEVGAILAVVLVNVFPLTAAPCEVGVHELPDRYPVTGCGVYAGIGDFGNEFCPFTFGQCGPDTLTVPADCFPVPLALSIGIAKTVDAIRLSRLGVAFLGRQAIENAFKLYFYVFSGSYVVHGSMITANPSKGKMIIRPLSKMDFRDKNDEDIYLFLLIIFGLSMKICEGL
ncbi:hypothetical protein [Desulfovibrio sp. ZJ369]|uniref:hypothetical protein n=1 Tax=Desulfovibrio sp. ZJ369 TaxID=2709793 RepID=UPI0013EBAD09|nr:hypothetical protein [Desulfovibrio sp. ZJ369]